MMFTIKVYTIVGQFLLNNLKLLHSLSNKPSYLVQNFFNRT